VYKKVSPVAAAKRVLRAFPFPKPDAEISQRHIEDEFRRRNIPTSEAVIGLRYATLTGWIRPTHLHSFVLTRLGVETLGASASISQTHPTSPFQAWAHK
jgi:hypothetical protein